jgi:putative nucleotidyltransferase with HDIG domain
VSVILLDIVRIDLFERATISPSAVPTLALAFLFGPVGPVAAEAVAAAVNLLRHKALVKTAFDFGALSIAGAVAAVTFAAVPTGSHPGLLAASALGGLVYYATNVPLLALVMSLAEGTSPLAAWRERLAWLWPHYVGFGLLAGTFTLSERELGPWAFVVFGLPLFMMWVAEKQYVDRSRESVTELRDKNEELERANVRLHALLDDNRALIVRMQRSYLTTITSLARTIEAKDPYTGGHTERVAEFARLLAVELGFGSRDLQAVHVGALIHDIGKIGVPDRVLLKPGKLDEDEFAEIRRHPEISSYIVADLDLPPIVKQMVRSHHERYDGRGYPDGLSGEEIPLAARVLSVADALDAMTSDRPYRSALPLVAALAEIQAQAGGQFCPRVVKALDASFSRDSEPWGALGLVEPAGSEAQTPK